MKTRIHFTIPVALVCILLAHGARAQSSRIGPADIYPDPARTPGAATNAWPTIGGTRVSPRTPPCRLYSGISKLPFLSPLRRASSATYS
jgi:hypothetical protein